MLKRFKHINLICYNKNMDNNLNQIQEIEQLLSKENFSKLQQDFINISKKYREENINSGSVVNNDKQALSYVASRMNETSIIVDKVLKTIFQVVDKSEVESVLDLGSGTGSVLWALENFFSNINITAVEREKCMQKYAKVLCKSLNLNIEYVLQDVLSKETNNLSNCDLVIESFMLNEMAEKDSYKALDLMINKANKYILLVEPGTPKSYQKMMQIRDCVVAKNLKVLLPCTHCKKCPLINDYCNFTVRLNRSKFLKNIKGGALGYEDEKYFYLLLSKQDIKNVENMVIRKPIVRKSCIDLKLCNNGGKVNNITITKKDKENYSKAKKIKHGDIFNF